MAMTLTEAQKYTTNMVKKGVLEEIVKDSVVMGKLPFIDIVGNAYQYLRETTLPTAAFYNPNEVWAEDTGQVTQKTAGIKILGGDADLDNFLKATRSDKTDLAAETIQSKAKAVKHTFLNQFYYGDSSVDTKSFDGLHVICNGADMTNQVIHQGSGSTGAALSAFNLDKMVDLVLDGYPDCILLDRNLRRRLRVYLRLKNNVEVSMAGFSSDVPSWNGVPVEYDDFLVHTETISSGAYTSKTGSNTGSVMALRFGTNDLCGLQNGGIETIKIGQVQDKDAQRWRLRWYCGLALFRDISTAIIDGITDATVTD